MKKFLLFLTLFLSAVGIANAAEEPSYAITFKCTGTEYDNNTAFTTETAINDIVESGSDYLSSIAETDRAYIGKSTNGMKLGASGKAGYITFAVAPEGQVSATKVVINAARYKSNKAVTLSVFLNGSTSENLQEPLPESSDFADYTITLSKPTTISKIKLASTNYMFVKSITVYYEDGTASKAPHRLSYEPTSVILEPYQVLASQPKLNNPYNLTVAYSSSNTDVATVTEEGVIALAGGLGEAVISAKFAGDETYEAGSATFTITVREAVYADAIYTLVTNVNDIQAGDIVVIAANGKVMGNTYKENNRPAIAGKFYPDKTYLYGAADVLRLKVLKTADGFFMFQTENYAGTNGFLSSTNSTSKNLLKVLEETSDYTMATVTITEAGVATIRFNKGNRNDLRLNLNDEIFSCYGSTSDFTAVSIYRATSHPATIEAQIDEPEFVESSVKLTNLVQLSKEATATKYAVLINGVEAGVFTVTKTNETSLVDIKLSGVPYLPEAKYTICPVLAEDAEGNPTTLGHPEELTFTFPTLPVVDFSANNSVLYFDAEKYADAKECNLDAWTYLTVNFKETAESENYLDEKDVRRNLALNFEEFGKDEYQLIGWYDEKKDQVQWCQYNFLENVTVVDGKPQITLGAVKPIGKLTLNAYFTFNVAPEYASLIATPGSLSAPARVAGGSVVQKVAGNTITVTGLTWPTNENALVSGVESVVVEGVDGAVEYYNMQGVRVEGELAPGMYIRRQGRSVSKVQIR